jgi:hypothetical protein
MLQLVHLVLDLLQPAKRGERRFVNRGTGFEMNVLVQQAEPQAARAHYVATIRRLITSDETEDRALACAVPAYKSDVFAGIDLQGRASQHVLNSVGLMYF